MRSKNRPPKSANVFFNIVQTVIFTNESKKQLTCRAELMQDDPSVGLLPAAAAAAAAATTGHQQHSTRSYQQPIVPLQAAKQRGSAFRKLQGSTTLNTGKSASLGSMSGGWEGRAETNFGRARGWVIISWSCSGRSPPKKTTTVKPLQFPLHTRISDKRSLGMTRASVRKRTQFNCFAEVLLAERNTPSKHHARA